MVCWRFAEVLAMIWRFLGVIDCCFFGETDGLFLSRLTI